MYLFIYYGPLKYSWYMSLGLFNLISYPNCIFFFKNEIIQDWSSDPHNPSTSQVGVADPLEPQCLQLGDILGVHLGPSQAHTHIHRHTYIFLKKSSWAVVAHAFNPSTWEAKASRSLWVQGQPGLQQLVPGQAPKLQRNPVLKKTKQNKKIKTKSSLM